ncbi:hypothetical protein, partial [Helicobacter ganmani]|uniref:hypothetical protein n=1 Tax=Helicobacter ganmani TaxID=60246 RepID=UPI003A83F6FA
HKNSRTFGGAFGNSKLKNAGIIFLFFAFCQVQMQKKSKNCNFPNPPYFPIFQAQPHNAKLKNYARF